MKINDAVIRTVGSTVLFGKVSDTKKESGWLYVKVDWVPSKGLQLISTCQREQQDSRESEFIPNNEWLRVDSVTLADLNEIQDCAQQLKGGNGEG